MQINVAQLLKSPIGSSRTIEIDKIHSDNIVDGLSGTITLVRIDKGILARGMMKATIKGECNRCLETITREIEFHMEEEFLPTLDIESDMPLDHKADILTIDNNHILDLSNIIKQYIIMSTPMKLVCRDDCAGICATCGKNLNTCPCNCMSNGKYDSL